MVHISRLRSKIEDDPQKPTYLKTIRGIGYKLHYTGKGHEARDPRQFFAHYLVVSALVLLSIALALLSSPSQPISSVSLPRAVSPSALIAMITRRLMSRP